MNQLSNEIKNNKINDNSDENKSTSDHEDEEWEDITHCSFQPKITIELSMASGGSHAWSYILEWDDEFDTELSVVLVVVVSFVVVVAVSLVVVLFVA